MSKSQSGRKITWSRTIAEKVRKVSAESAEMIRARINNGERVIDIAREFGLHRTTVSKIKLGTYLRFGQGTKALEPEP